MLRFVVLFAVALLLLQSLAVAAVGHGSVAGAASIDSAVAPCVGNDDPGKAPSPLAHPDHAGCCLNSPQRAQLVARIGIETTECLPGVAGHFAVRRQYEHCDDNFRTMPGWTTSWSSRAPPVA